MVASNVGSRKASYLRNAHAGSETFLHHDIAYLVVVLFMWAVPCRYSGSSVGPECVCHHTCLICMGKNMKIISVSETTWQEFHAYTIISYNVEMFQWIEYL